MFKNTAILEAVSPLTDIIVAEFGHIPLYFPIYYAQRLGFYEQHDLDVKFISTKGDYETYLQLINGTAQIGISDPLFSMFKPNEKISGKIIGELICKNPLVAVAIDPQITVADINDLKKYSIGSYKKFSTSYVFSSYVSKDSKVTPYERDEIVGALINGKIDIAIILLEDCGKIIKHGGKIIYSFREDWINFCFTGITTTNTIWDEYESKIRGFLVATQEGLRHLRKNNQVAKSIFEEMFYEIEGSENIFAEYLGCRKENIIANEYDVQRNYAIRKKIYPDIMDRFQAEVFKQDTIQNIVNIFTGKKYKKDHPFLEEGIYEVVKNSILENISIPIYMFRGCSNKAKYDISDINTLNYLMEIEKSIEELYSNGCKFTIILADEHGKNNGYDSSTIMSYFNSLAPLLEERNMNFIFLSKIYEHYNFQREESINLFEKQQLADRWLKVRIGAELEITSKKNYSGKDHIRGAQRYYILRVLEKSLLEDYFNGSIFMTYSNSSSQSILPQMPTLYTFTEKKGYSELPWFKSNL